MTAESTPAPAPTWHKTACILCECNCGLEVQLGGEDDRHIVRIRGDRAHPSSQGYACEKPHRLDYYQNSEDRLTQPLRRKEDGTFEPIDWDTAIREIADRFARIRDTHGGESIFYYGGGGQGNHLPGAYAAATRRVLKSRFRSSALAQEKTGEFWVSDRMMGSMTRGDFEHCDVAVFIGKNPWQSHSIARARVTLKEIARDPNRTMIVIDPRRSETAAMADIHLQVRPGGDAWLLAALGAVLIDEDLVDHDFIAAHTRGFDDVKATLGQVSVADFCQKAGVDESLVRTAARRIADANGVATFEDLGVQMNKHSTLVSYLHRFLFLLTGNFAKKGANCIPTPLVNLASGAASSKTSPVADALIIGGMVPCNVIADEILTDHPKRYRAMLIEAANPAHSLADSQKFRQALQALDTVVVIDIAMTETARLADYVLPTPTQFEKAEATFFNFEIPHNYFHLRHPLFSPPDGVLTEAEIHARLCEALGAVTADDIEPLAAAAEQGLEAFGATFGSKVMADPRLSAVAPVLLYRALGPTLPDGLAPAAVLWGATARCAMSHGASLERAGFTGSPIEVTNRVFERILAEPSGVVFAVDEHTASLARIQKGDRRIDLALPDLLAEIDVLHREDPSVRDAAFPLVLSAGERRSFTANTIFRNPEWRKKDAAGALRVSPADADAIGIRTSERVRLVTKKGNAEVVVEVSDIMAPGHISLPNGQGIGRLSVDGASTTAGVAPNELTAAEDRDRFAGTPWHKFVPARIEKLA